MKFEALNKSNSGNQKQPAFEELVVDDRIVGGTSDAEANPPQKEIKQTPPTTTRKNVHTVRPARVDASVDVYIPKRKSNLLN